MSEKIQEIFGEVIFSYSRKKAIEDGVLVDLNQYIPIEESGYKYPIACTEAVWRLIDEAVQNKKWCHDYKGIIRDIFFMDRNAPMRKWETVREFPVIIKGFGRKSIFHLKIECGPGDDGEPVLTVMFTNED